VGSSSISYSAHEYASDVDNFLLLEDGHSDLLFGTPFSFFFGFIFSSFLLRKKREC
jgi:hypothetical protein